MFLFFASTVCWTGSLFTKENLFEVYFLHDNRAMVTSMPTISNIKCFVVFVFSICIFAFAIERLTVACCIPSTKRNTHFKIGIRFDMLDHNSTPYFELRSLNSGVGYNVFLIASNAKGRSNSTVRQVFTLNNPEKQTDTSSLLASTPSLANLKTFLPFVLFGCAGAIALTAIIVVFIIRKRANGTANSSNDALADQSTGGNSDRGETASYALTTQRTLQSSQEVARDLCADSNESMEKNPDIIPQGNHFSIIPFSLCLSTFISFCQCLVYSLPTLCSINLYRMLWWTIVLW